MYFSSVLSVFACSCNFSPEAIYFADFSHLSLVKIVMNLVEMLLSVKYIQILVDNSATLTNKSMERQK